MAEHEAVHRARVNGRHSGHVPGATPINSDQVVDLLVAAAEPGRHFAVRRNANALLEDMARAPWRVSAGIHEGGRGDDWTRHVTVSFGPGRSFHLRLDRRNHLFQVSGPGLVDFAPWASPGSSPTTR